MKALTLMEPWATLVVNGDKRMETRSWHAKRMEVPFPLAIHASQSVPWYAAEMVTDLGHAISRALKDRSVNPITGQIDPGYWESDLAAGIPHLPPASLFKVTRGCVIGFVTVTGFQHTEDVRFEPGSEEEDFGDFSTGRWAWDLAHPVLLQQPIPYKGSMGLWAFPENLHVPAMEYCRRSEFSVLR